MATQEALDTAAQAAEDQEIARMVDEGCPDFMPPEPDTMQAAEAPADQTRTPQASSVFQRLQERHGVGAKLVAQHQQADYFPNCQISGD